MTQYSLYPHRHAAHRIVTACRVPFGIRCVPQSVGVSCCAAAPQQQEAG